jgi:hypothetical protein
LRLLLPQVRRAPDALAARRFLFLTARLRNCTIGTILLILV